MHPPERLRVEIYVDDPVFAACGTRVVVARSISVALLWFVVLGFPLAWIKTEGGNCIQWIGANIQLHARGCDVVIPEDKAVEVHGELMELLKCKAVPLRRLQQVAGKLNFFAGLVPVMRPFLCTIWAAISEAARVGSCDGPLPISDSGGVGGPESSRRALRYVPVRRCAHGLRWCAAFLSHQRGTIRRQFFFGAMDSRLVLSVSVDASPWGIGGVLSQDSRPIAWFASPIFAEDLQRFQATRGDSGFTTLWEALAVLVAIKLWRQGHAGLRVALRSDSLATLCVLAKGSSRNAGISLVAAELALEQAEFSVGLETLTHIPGISNVLPDALSRLWAPEPCQVPSELDAVERTQVPRRHARFWRILRIRVSCSSH